MVGRRFGQRSGRWLAMLATMALGPATISPAAGPVSLLLKPAGVFDAIDGKVHAGWQVLVTGDRIAAVGPALSVPAGDVSVAVT